MQWKTNKLIDLKKQYADELYPIYGKHESDAMLTILIERFFQISKLKLALEPDFRLSESEILRLHFAVKELKNHKPIQYITKNVEFLNLRIMVNESVLIPRPETEELASYILDSEKETGLEVLDIGTGSGCLAISLAKNLDNAKISAIDISDTALKTASKNAFVNEVMVHFDQFNILIPDDYPAAKTYDVIVSNPPYVTISDKALMSENVLNYEPHSALFVEGDDPLLFYKAIVYFAADHLKPGGRIYFEINEKFGEEVCSLLSKYGYSSVSLKKDFHNKDRFVSGVRHF